MRGKAPCVFANFVQRQGQQGNCRGAGSEPTWAERHRVGPFAEEQADFFIVKSPLRPYHKEDASD